ncbi:Protein ALP1-like [Holothuria leucospilota]|uniref:Protein ALP1-like n=1 Tax=Holothuria leucospilota TaxID=206669 RepID=A0A9Q1H6N0_HOLLE|nr:Protein ALP1-like [Holothuria leucospilota]
MSALFYNHLYVSGDTYRSLSYLFRVSHNSITKIIPETCQALYAALKDQYFQCPRTPDEWKLVADEYWRRWNFPNCVGSLDGKHIMIQQPACSGAKFFNYKHHFSLILMALADANYKFLFVDIGAQGTTHSEALPFCIVADDAFPLKYYLQKPYPHRNLTKEQRIYNYRLSRARRCIENAFGILSNRFRVFLKPIALTPDKVDAVVMASCALHNMLRTEAPSSYILCGDVEDHASHEITQGTWRLAGSLPAARLSSRRSATQSAKTLRDAFCRYFNSDEGSVPWQEDMIYQ